MITMDSFGSMCPQNWEEIANYLNNIIDSWPEMEEDELHTEVNNLWEEWCAGELEGAPEPIM